MSVVIGSCTKALPAKTINPAVERYDHKGGDRVPSKEVQSAEATS